MDVQSKGRVFGILSAPPQKTQRLTEGDFLQKTGLVSAKSSVAVAQLPSYRGADALRSCHTAMVMDTL